MESSFVAWVQRQRRVRCTLRSSPTPADRTADAASEAATTCRSNAGPLLLCLLPPQPPPREALAAWEKCFRTPTLEYMLPPRLLPMAP
eukprot:CAMPEP_0172894730 /NCGR_PEP_ID=MMETSP1075-20121228/151514_1 /TAXON_ID=2916 /ORGANISM="Ceratium fusus, Strain PA161109" /LENGTH=87 /DNA_ID=CAMNT_0013749801 /DNA_START=283 /DNA_END=546 /DNA_ORIENTATION=-